MNILSIKFLVLFLYVLAINITMAYATDKENAHVQNMHEHMTAMHAQMQTIHAEKEPEKRKQLMHAHRQSMLDGMKIMHAMNHRGGVRMMHEQEHIGFCSH